MEASNQSRPRSASDRASRALSNCNTLGVVTTSDEPALERLADLAEPARLARPSLGRVTRRLTAVNFVITLSAVVTGPLQARALGPAGRGDLAAVVVVGTLVASFGDLGLSAFVLRETAAGTPLRKLIGSIGPLLCLLGCCWAVAGLLIVARAVAGNRETVYWLLVLVFLCTPIQLLASGATSIVWGQQRWSLYTVLRLIVPVGTAIAFAILFVVGNLTVETAGIVFIVLGVFVSSVPAFVVLRGVGRPEWSFAVVRRGGAYGIRVWLAGIANQTNTRFDQLLMTRLVTPSQLGTYAVAVNVSLIQIGLASAAAQALLPRVAAGDAHIAARALRVMVALTTLICASLMVAVPFVLPFVFGKEFSGAVVMCQILLLAAVPFGAVVIMTNVLAGLGRPTLIARAELLSVCITVPALLAFVHRYAGVGAAVISVVAYSCTASYLAVQLRPLLGVSWSAMFIMRPSDVRILKTLPIIRTFARKFSRRPS